ncbi:hypothetical protein LCGC14_2885160 [marine sediment metagenome]|uniref:Uncharacterized protein n=1 Tax=marine sediment metagenome TaxID=412755 RepID=A0A0F8YKP4_9ZZZZ
MKLFRTIQEFLAWRRDYATGNPYELTGEEAAELVEISFESVGLLHKAP